MVVNRKVPTAPKGITPAGKQFWNTIWKNATWLDAVDVVTVQRALKVFELLEYKSAQMISGGGTEEDVQVVNENGYLQEHPNVKAIESLEKQLERYLGLLSLNPVSRSRAGIEAVSKVNNEASSMDKYLDAINE